MSQILKYIPSHPEEAGNIPTQDREIKKASATVNSKHKKETMTTC